MPVLSTGRRVVPEFVWCSFGRSAFLNGLRLCFSDTLAAQRQLGYHVSTLGFKIIDEIFIPEASREEWEIAIFDYVAEQAYSWLESLTQEERQNIYRHFSRERPSFGGQDGFLLRTEGGDEMFAVTVRPELL